ncbi:type II toxin-antitoxin system VapC family toxin [Mucilaginibacter mali]|uniref:Type II toxin-antitoxin system VapC family toxin n=1 Tax=Mucilaginibacter mali TaxID=2740462 RepID=A0A7D4PX50_9SPHI|nr:type II toxin-antitoxin system VapC family toxin [Mucilaginibacter mali]
MFDTNILIHLAKDNSLRLLQRINPDNQKVYISVVALAELKSFALQNNWGPRRLNLIGLLLEDISAVTISDNLTDTYAQIDAYSQRRNRLFTEYNFTTARNMGKNDLWIAATAALLGLKLVTTDGDFDHLHEVFFDVKRLRPADLR